jgi:chemotaxis protein histidine kinase CheA
MMIGLPQGGATIHSVESVLDRGRSHRLEITPDVVDLLMDGVSYIEEVVRTSVAGQWEDKSRTDILDRSRQLLSEQPEVQTKVTDVGSEDVDLSHEAAYRAIIHRKRRTPCYRCYLEFDSGKQPAFLVACMIYRRFCDLGDVLGTIPSLSDIEKGMMEGKFKLLFASEISQELLEQTLDQLLREHYGAHVIELTRFE